MSGDLEAIVNEVIAASPAVPDSIHALTLTQRKELDALVKRSAITPEAALAVLRGRRQEQHAALERDRAASALAESVRVY